jgi:hypothetical protein
MFDDTIFCGVSACALLMLAILGILWLGDSDKKAMQQCQKTQSELTCKHTLGG